VGPSSIVFNCAFVFWAGLVSAGAHKPSTVLSMRAASVTGRRRTHLGGGDVGKSKRSVVCRQLSHRSSASTLRRRLVAPQQTTRGTKHGRAAELSRRGSEPRVVRVTSFLDKQTRFRKHKTAALSIGNTICTARSRTDFQVNATVVSFLLGWSHAPTCRDDGAYGRGVAAPFGS
jgi:hypothetical protein